jgi:hypothetical protein
MKCVLSYFLSLLLLGVLVVTTRTANGERSMTISAIVTIAPAAQDENGKILPVDAQETFDNFTWSTKEKGFVQALTANGTSETEEVVFVNNWTLADAPDSFVVQWTYNDNIVWNSHEFCQNHNNGIRPAAGNSGDCLDNSTTGVFFWGILAGTRVTATWRRGGRPRVWPA